jgi:CBS domain-containing protein
LQETGHKDHFLQLMFFQASHRIAALLGSQHPELATGDYAALRHSTAKRGDRYHLPLPTTPSPIRLDSPATEVMTDLRRVSAVTVDRHTSIDEANRAMIVKGVRALFVVDDARGVQGFITSTDILGERPIQFAQERGIRHTEVMVRDVMTPADRLEILDFPDVERARVGDVVATLRLVGRQHALAVETTETAAGIQRTVRGIFSLTQIARQLGVPPQQIYHIARTFAEIGAAISA